MAIFHKTSNFSIVTKCKYRKIDDTGLHICCRYCRQHRDRCEFKIIDGTMMVIFNKGEFSKMPALTESFSKIKAAKSFLVNKAIRLIENLTPEEKDNLIDIDILKINNDNCSLLLLNKNCVINKGKNCA